MRVDSCEDGRVPGAGPGSRRHAGEPCRSLTACAARWRLCSSASSWVSGGARRPPGRPRWPGSRCAASPSVRGSSKPAAELLDRGAARRPARRSSTISADSAGGRRRPAARVHERLGVGVRARAERRRRSRAAPGCATSTSSSSGSSARARLATRSRSPTRSRSTRLGGAGGRARHRPRGAGRDGSARLQPLRLDPELGGVHAELERRPRAASAVASCGVADLGEHERHPREGACARRAPSTRSSSERACCDDVGQQAPGGVEALGESRRRPRRAGRCRGRGRRAAAPPCTGKYPERSKAPVRFTPQASPPTSAPSSPRPRSAAFWPAASASKKVTTSSQ